MNDLSKESQATEDYFLRLEQRLREEEDVVRKLIRLRAIIASAQCHFLRFERAQRRYQRAVHFADKTAQLYERETMLALLYEIADTVYMVINLLDLHEMHLVPSQNGEGIAGDHAVDVVHLVDNAEQICRKILEMESELGLQLDFQRPVDEREGITFRKRVHWQDFVEGSVDLSFRAYFYRAQRAVKQRMAEVIPFFNCTVREQLHRKGRHGLLEVIGRLERASLSLQVERVVEKPARPLNDMPHAKAGFFSWTNLNH